MFDIHNQSYEIRYDFFMLSPERRNQVIALYASDMMEILAELELGNIPKQYPRGMLMQALALDNGQYLNVRDKYIKSIGFPLIAENWVKPLAKWIGKRPCLEVMAGTGYLSYALNKYGVQIKATDNFSWSNKFKTILPMVEDIESVDAVRKYGKHIEFIICSWPYMDEKATEILLTMREVNPKCRMIYIGEPWGGCTASDSFFEAAEICEVQGFNHAISKYRHWASLNDTIMLIK